MLREVLHVSEYFQVFYSLKLAEERSWLSFKSVSTCDGLPRRSRVFAGMCELRNDGSVRGNQIRVLWS